MKAAADEKQHIQIVGRDATIEEVSRVMEMENVSAVLVIENGVLIGTVTDRDIALRAMFGGKDPRRITVSEVMTPLLDGCLCKAMRQSELHVLE